MTRLLIKYSPDLRFLQNSLIRFSQPSALNDLEEARPRIKTGEYAAEDFDAARVDALSAGFTGLSDEDLQALFMTPFPSHRYDEISFPNLWPRVVPQLRKEPFKTIAEFDRALAERAAELALLYADANIGILSLTTAASEQMWAYYAKSHTGVEIAFDADHDFFREGRPVDYSTDYIHSSSNEGWTRLAGERISNDDILNGTVSTIPKPLLFRKQKSWAHEQEWRMIKPLSSSDVQTGVDENGYPVHLYRVPPDAVHSITLGYRATAKNIEQAKALFLKSEMRGFASLQKRIRSNDDLVEVSIT